MDKKVLIACEESQTICAEFRSAGIEAYSCDIIDCSGGHPEWHMKQDVLPLLNGHCKFKTCDGVEHEVKGKWNLIVAHPPCTLLTVTGNRWFNEDRYGDKARQRKRDREDAIKFFMEFAKADCDYICIENPVGIMSTEWRKPNQIIQPWMFGDPYEKKTCLWLKNLPPLTEENPVAPPPRKKFASGKTMSEWYADAFKLPKEERSRLRSKTFPGIAKAIVNQWKDLI